MALTLAEAAKLSNDVLLQGVIETIVKESPVLQRLPFIEVVGNSLTYNRESTNPAATFYDVGDTWTEATPTFTQLTATLKILGTDADVDRYLQQTRSNVNDLEAEVIALRAKMVQQLFDKSFVTGDTVVDAKAFDGLRKLLLGTSQVVSSGTNGAALTLRKVDELIDQVKGRPPDILLMSKRSRRDLNHLARSSGVLIETRRDDFGRWIQAYDGIPLAVHDDISDSETVGTSTDCSIIYALRFGADAISGITAPGGLQVEEVGQLETKDARRWRIKWYAAMADFNTLGRAALTGVRPAA